MNYKEYLEERKKIDKYIMDFLKDDQSHQVVYMIAERNRQGSPETYTVFKKWSNVLNQIENDIYELKDFEVPNFKEVFWWSIRKHILIDGEYQEIIHCDITASGELYWFSPSKLGYRLFNNLLGCRKDILFLNNVDALYGIGDIVKVKCIPKGEDYYGIYGYGDKQHFLLCFDKEQKINFEKISMFYNMERVTEAPDEKLNEMSNKIRNNSKIFIKLINEHGITPF